MNKNHLLLAILAILIVFSCKKKDDETSSPTPANPGNMALIYVKSDVSCFSGLDGSIDITVKGGNPPYAFAWSSGSTDEDLVNIAAGSYIIEILDNEGFLLVDTITVDQPAKITITEQFLPDILDITVSGGTPPYKYLWSNGDTTEDLSPYINEACFVTVTDSNNCTANKEFEQSIADGIYVFGEACGISYPESTGMMQITRNEITQELRSSLYEIHIPLKAGTQGFNIIKVDGLNITTYGPGGDWGIVQDPIGDEPQDVPIQRGSAEETELNFNVLDDGMYHIVIDMEYMIAVVCQEHWGVIGSCMPLGWSTSMNLNESAFDPDNMIWEITDLTMNAGQWKFRYSNGWKIELFSDGGFADMVRVNTNFGGEITTLIPGGESLINEEAGIYTITMEYVRGEGYTANIIKTGESPNTIWTEVVCDAVGTGISADNPNAIPDPSSWGWGNQLIADNNGIPSVDGDIYTWTWTVVVFESDEGFKLRTLNGVTPPSGGANFDAGYSDLDVDASSPNVYDMDNNLAVNLKGVYSISLVIDAANSDKKTITITE